MISHSVSSNDDLFLVCGVTTSLELSHEPELLNDCIQKLLQQEWVRVLRDELKIDSYKIFKTRLQGLIFAYFSKIQIKGIDDDVMEGFVDYLSRQQLSGPTIKGYLALCMKLLRLMHKQHLLTQIPLIPAVKANYKPRGAFTLTEYKAITRLTRRLEGQAYDGWRKGKRIWIKDMYQVMPRQMNWLIRFMVYTFIRPGDIRQLKHKHIEVVYGKYTYLRLTLPEIKRHNAPMISLPPAVHLYQKIKAENERLACGGPDDYVFFPLEEDRKLALGIAGWLFNWVLYELDLKKGPHGAERSLYSLRHTAITFRLLYGGKIDLLTLAKNARTSVEMIERFYASTLAAEANVSLLHSRRGRNP